MNQLVGSPRIHTNPTRTKVTFCVGPDMETVRVFDVVGALGIFSMIMALVALIVFGVLRLIGVVTVPEVLQTLSTAVSGA